MFKKTRALSAIVGLVCAVALMAMGATALAATSKAKPKAKGKPDSGTNHVATTRQAGGIDYTAGEGTDKLFGPVAVTYANKILPSKGSFKVTANPVVLYTKTGTLRGTGSATITVTGATTAKVTGGKLNLTKGTGALTGHSFAGTFTGSGNPATGQFTFNYKGTYK